MMTVNGRKGRMEEIQTDRQTDTLTDRQNEGKKGGKM